MKHKFEYREPKYVGLILFLVFVGFIFLLGLLAYGIIELFIV